MTSQFLDKKTAPHPAEVSLATQEHLADKSTEILLEEDHDLSRTHGIKKTLLTCLNNFENHLKSLTSISSHGAEPFEKDSNLDAISSMKEYIDDVNIDLKHETEVIAKYSSEPIDGNVRDQLENQLSEVRKTNENLLREKHKEDEKLLELAGDVETITEEVKEKETQVANLQHQIESFSSETNFLNSRTDSSLHSQPASLPNVQSRHDSTSSPQFQSMLNEVKSSELQIRQLKIVNLQLQEMNQKLEQKMQRLNEEKENFQERILQLNTAINPNSDDVVRLNPLQQRYFDEFREKLELQLENLKENCTANDQLARRNIAAAQQQQAAVETKLPDLRQKLEQLESADRRQTTEMEELRTALIVATRVSPQSLAARNQATIDGLRSMAGRLESDIRRITNQYDSALAEKVRLQEEVNQLRSSGRIQQTIFNRNDGGTTSIGRSGNHVIIRNEGATISQEIYDPLHDIEFD